MNYIQQLNAFEEWIELNCLPATEELLWRRLFRLNNMFGWAEWFFIDNIKLAGRVGVSERALIDIRHRLQQRGLIDFIPGKKGKPTKYKLIQLYKNTEDTSVNISVQSSVNTSVNTSVKPSANINNKQKPKENKSIISDFCCENAELEQAVYDFIDMRKSIKKPITDRALKIMFDKLKEIGETQAEQIEILNKSTVHSWQGIFPLNNAKQSRQQVPKRNNEPEVFEC